MRFVHAASTVIRRMSRPGPEAALRPPPTLRGPEDCTFTGDASMADQHRGIDRAMENGRAQAGEQRAAVNQDQVILAAQSSQRAGPGWACQEIARA